jgi:hypothetical protein
VAELAVFFGVILISIMEYRTISIVKYTLRTFVNHVSIAKPLGESGKLQLTSDMAELEFALNAFMSEHGQNAAKLDVIGDDYRALRALRCVNVLNARSS